MENERGLIVVASSDWHIRSDQDNPRYLQTGQAIELIQEMSRIGDVILYCGDFTDFGPHADEGEILRSAQAAADIFRESSKTKLAVLGNHDFHNGKNEYIQRTLVEEGGVTMIQGVPYTLPRGDKTIGFAGVKGLGGGFGDYIIPRYGEEPVVTFRNAIDTENCILREDLLRLAAVDHIFVATHYAPIRETVLSEGPERFHGLGNSGLEKVIDEFSEKIVVVTHGHAHFGDPHGKTTKGIPVDNVSIQVLKKSHQETREDFIPTHLFRKYELV